MRILNKIFSIFEMFIPIVMLILLFVSFIIGIFSRYFLQNPLTWTYELSSICFLNLVVYSWPYVQKMNEHITFDMIYERVDFNTKFIFEILSHVLMAIFSLILVYFSLVYIKNIYSSVTQVIKIPKVLVYSCFPISFLLYFFRAFFGIFKYIKKDDKEL